MEALLSRFRNLTILLVAVVAQLLYLAYQVKTNGDERLIRVWAVTAVTPMAGIVEAIRHNTIGFLEDYFILLDVREQNRKLKATNDRLQMDNNYYRNQLATAEHARALVQFQSQNPSRTIAARVIGNSTVASAKAVFIDRGSTSSVETGMAVVTPEGIVGKVVAVYPLVSQVLLVTDPTFKVGVESQKGHVHGVLSCGTGKCVVEQIQNEDKVANDEWFYTSGEDRIFPKGFPVGKVISSQPGQGMLDVKLSLSAAPGSAEEVLVILQGVHRPIPTTPPVEDELRARMLPPPPSETSANASAAIKPQTEADKVLAKYESLGKEQGHVYGGLGSPIPDFNLKPPGTASVPSPASSKPVVPVDPTRSDTQASSATPGSDTQTTRTATQPTSAPQAPAVLGSRQTPREVISAGRSAGAASAPPASGPVLPLGSPRPKSTPPKPGNSAPSQPRLQ